MMRRQTLLQIRQVGGKAQHGHDLAGHGDVKAVLAGHALHPAAQAVHDVAQLPVVHVHAALPGDVLHVDIQRIALLDVVVQHGGQQVVGRADGVEIAGEVEVDVLHGHHLRIAAAGSAALYAEHRAQGGLPQAEQDVLAQLAPARRPDRREVVVLPSPAGVGLMAVTRISLPLRGLARSGVMSILAFTFP